MRRAVVTAALLAAACAPTRDLAAEIPAGAVTVVYVTFAYTGTAKDALAFEASSTAAVLLAAETEDTQAVLFYDRDFEALGMTVGADHHLAFTTDTDDLDSQPLPAPPAGLGWKDLVDGRAVEPTRSFEERFATVRLPLLPCEKLQPLTQPPQIPLLFAHALVFVAPLGATGAVAGTRRIGPNAGAIFRVDADGKGEMLAAVTPTIAPGGFGLENGEAWYLFHAPDGSPQLCQLAPGAAPSCAPMTFADPRLDRFETVAIAGHLVDGEMEGALITNEGELWIGRGRQPWRRILDSNGRWAECRGGFPTVTLGFDGPDHGHAGIIGGPIVTFTTAGEIGTLFDLGPNTISCRSAYGRFPDGVELLIYEDHLSEGGRTFWRRAGEPWEPLGLPADVFLATRTITPIREQLLISASGGDARFAVHDPRYPLRPPRFCPKFPVGNSMVSVAPVSDRVYFGGDNAVSNISWLFR